MTIMKRETRHTKAKRRQNRNWSMLGTQTIVHKRTMERRKNKRTQKNNNNSNNNSTVNNHWYARYTLFVYNWDLEIHNNQSAVLHYSIIFLLLLFIIINELSICPIHENSKSNGVKTVNVFDLCYCRDANCNNCIST